MLSLILLSALLSGAQSQAETPLLDYVCPMDPDVRAALPGTCSRCGMKLTVGVIDPIEYGLDVKLRPRAPRADQPVELIFAVSEPNSDKPVQDFEIVHEKTFHLFVVSEDLDFFLHEHPVLGSDRRFRFRTRFPKPGMYRLLCDFYPRGGTPQLLARTVLIPGTPRMPLPVGPGRLSPDLSEKSSLNMAVELVMQPSTPIAGMKTLLFFRIKPADGLEKYLGSWSHLLAFSDDLVDAMHAHPFLADGGPQVQFNLIFPRAHTYRIWAQFQRKGVVNTVVFDVPVSELK
ncbi:MAG TPA: heavy metal-binding domain-containing protein [Terriglobia bacterium]|nr:heavy metal-binding domain-containing protein [Terriglobia bacterium]